MSAHTPGPWRYCVTNGSPTTGMYLIAGAKPGYLAEVRDCGSGDVHANARLIAAAPELLEALKGFLAIVSDSRGVAGYHLNGNTAEWDEFDEVDAAIDAIAKATGDDDAAPECTCAAKDMTFGRCCKVTPNIAVERLESRMGDLP